MTKFKNNKALLLLDSIEQKWQPGKTCAVLERGSSLYGMTGAVRVAAKYKAPGKPLAKIRDDNLPSM